MKNAIWNLALLSAIVGLMVKAEPIAANPGWKPERNVEILAAAAPGGGYDITARTIQRIMQSKKMVDIPIIVTNRAGGGGNVGYAYFAQRAGDPSIITILAPTVMGNHITGRSPMNYTDFTAVATLYSEAIGFATKADSPIKTGKDLIDRLRKDPSSVSIGLGISLGNALHVATALVARHAGVDAKRLRVVVFNSQAEVITAGVGGHVDVIVTRPSNMVGMLQSNQLRAFGVTSAERDTGATANIPTWREQGVDAVYSNWFAIIAPKGIPMNAIAYWDHQFKSLTASEEWQAHLRQQQWTPEYRDSRETRAFFDSEYKLLRGVLADLGMARN
jgi:putative tricarboxylic transport membrane protein